jgi:hypothetical protein
MQGRFLGQLVPDMDVCDANGDKIGTITHVHRYDVAMVGGGRGDGQPPHEEVLEVKTGFLGLGKRLYIPLSAVQNVSRDCVFVSHSREDIEDLSWDEEPSYLAELH